MNAEESTVPTQEGREDVLQGSQRQAAVPASQGRQESAAQERQQEGLFVRLWRSLFYLNQGDPLEKERQVYLTQIHYLQEQIKGLELERQRLLDRLLLKNSVPPVHAKLEQKKPQPSRLPHEQAVEETRHRVEEDKQRRAVAQARLESLMRSRGLSLANVDPSVYDEVTREVS